MKVRCKNRLTAYLHHVKIFGWNSVEQWSDMYIRRRYCNVRNTRATKLTELGVFLQWEVNGNCCTTFGWNLAAQRLFRVQIQDTADQVCMTIQLRINCEIKEHAQFTILHTWNQVDHASWRVSRLLLAAGIRLNSVQVSRST